MCRDIAPLLPCAALTVHVTCKSTHKTLLSWPSIDKTLAKEIHYYKDINN